MKSGTGDDPFAEEETDDQPDETPPEAESGGSSEGTPAAVEAPTEAAEASESDAETAASESSAAGAGAGAGSAEAVDSADIPWVLRRGSVKDDRPNMTQFFLQDATDRAEREFQRDVENILEKDVYLLDLREAAYQVAMAHPEEVAEVLRDWGYDYL
jgi:flagellar biosynthesis/type III secretory pathway M-ring protein FliF/YscJ